MEHDIEFVFFDIGGTLGNFNPSTNTLVPFPSSAKLLHTLRDQMGLRIGIITTLGSQLTNPEALAMLQNAGLKEFLDPVGFVSDRDAHTAKPNPAIYKFAADTVGVEINRCLYVGENFVEVIGALQAGMKALLKPSPPGSELPG